MLRIRTTLLLPLLLISALSACAHFSAGHKADPAADIRATLDAQVAAWNRGDLEGFMQGYWHDDALRFASGGRVTHGWQTTLEHYRKGYPDRSAMGTLSFSELEIEPLADDTALVFGHWSLQRAKDQPHGLFTLLLRKTADGWKITRDHTSAAE